MTSSYARSLGILLAMVMVAPAQDPDAVDKKKVHKHHKEGTARAYWHGAFGPFSFVASLAGAGLDQARNAPREWGGGMEGFGKRFGSVFGTHVVKSTIKFGIAKALHEELRYEPSGQERFGPRLKYALLRTVITQKTTTGKKTLAFNEIGGVTGSAIISRLWQPARLRTIGSGFSSAGISLGIDAGFNVTREFWPEIRHHGKVNSAKAPLVPAGSSAASIHDGPAEELLAPSPQEQE